MPKILTALTVLLFVIVSCSRESAESYLTKKATYFDSIGYQTFNNYSIQRLRPGKNSSYQVSRFDTSGEYAIIRLLPAPEVEKNFLTDSIDLHFVTQFGILGCRSLICQDHFVRMGFRLEEQNALLYSGTPSKPYYLPIDTSKSVKINENWAYVLFQRE